MKKIVLFSFLFSFLFSVFSQQNDTAYTSIFKHLSDYRNYNEVYLGNLGLAKYNLLTPFDDNNKELKSLFPVKSNSNKYTDIFYALGSGKENYFELNHHQKLGEFLIGEAKILKTNSIGIYRSQLSKLSDFRVSLDYNPKKDRYGFKAEFKNYKRFNEINGGVKDSSFYAFLDSNNARIKTTFPIQLPNLTTSSNALELKIMDIKYQHSFRINKEKNDSAGYFQLVQTLGYQRTMQTFETIKVNDYFDNFYYDSLTTNDSLKQVVLFHRTGVEYVKNNQKIEIGIGQNYYEYESYSPFQAHLENLLYASYLLRKNKINFLSNAEYLVSKGGYESFSFQNKLIYHDDKLSVFDELEANLNVMTDLPELYYDSYASNHYKWNRVNKLNQIIQANVTAKNKSNKVSVGINFESQSSVIYFDSLSQIGQTSISLLGFSLKKEFKLAKFLYFSTQLNVQDVLSSEAIEVPNLVTFNKLYFRGRLFKKVLTFNLGVNVLYYSSFVPRAYNPALDKFHVQTEQKVGNYPYIDLFGEFYIKNKFAFFVAITHVNSNLITGSRVNSLYSKLKINSSVNNDFGKNFLAAPDYPSQDRSFKFGVKWRLFD